MDHLDDIHRRMRIANLEARRELREIERADLSRKIDSPLTTTPERKAAMERRDAVITEWAGIVEQLQVFHSSDSSQLELCVKEG